MSPCHLYVVEDDADTRQMLCGYLEQRGATVTGLRSAEELMQRLRSGTPDLIVLDIGLPGMSGLQACQRLRLAGERVPVILLTARSEEVDRVLGLEMGADDYLGKPFSARELQARIHAVLRRTQADAPAPADEAPPVRIGDWLFCATSHTVQRGDEVRPLNTVEFGLLAELVAHVGEPVSRERLLAASHPEPGQVLLRAVDAAVMRLRKLVEPDPAQPRYVQTVRGQGYMFVPARGPSGVSGR